MIKILLIFILPITIYASKILSYNIYDRTDRVDVMITFDTPYEGAIRQSANKSKIIIKLQNAEIESSKLKKLSTKFLKSISITPMSQYTQIVASVPSSVRLIASKTSDAYGLRLRFTNRSAEKNSNSIITENEEPSLSHLPTKKEEGLSTSYYIVVTILLIGIIILFMIQRKIKNTNTQRGENPWLFKEKMSANTPVEKSYTSQINTNNVSIRFQKEIDEKNSVVMLDFGEQSYLVLMGQGNILLDKFRDNIPDTQEKFEEILQSRHQELDEFLRVEKKEETKEPLQAYKERAASIIYSEGN